MGDAKRRAEQAKMISVLIPERGRPEALDRCIVSLIDTAGIDDAIEILVFIDNDDPAWQDREPLAHSRVRYLRRPRPITLGEKLNELAKEARGDSFFFLANDMTMDTPGWPAMMRAAMAALPNGIGVLYARDELHPGHASYWLMTRKMRDAIGFFAAPWFPYWFVDTWATELGIMTGLFREMPVAVGSPDGRGKSHALIDLAFWAKFFHETRPLRMRDAINLATIAYGEGSAGLADVMTNLARRNALCVHRSAHLSSQSFLEVWGGNADSPPSPQYPEVKAYAESLLTQINKNTPRRLKVAICCPSGRTWEATAANSIAAMSAHTAQAGIDLAFLNVQSSDVSHGRNKTVELALNEGMDYLLFVDSDIVMPPDALLRLLAHKKDIVGATYNRRSFPHTTLGKLAGPKPTQMTDGLHEALLMPGGMMLVRTEVFRTLGYPCYAFAYQFPGDDGLAAFKALMRAYFSEEPPADVLAALDATPFGAWIKDHYTLGEFGEKYDSFSEDLFFSRRARRAGFQIWCDIALTGELVHLGQLDVTCKLTPDIVRTTHGAAHVNAGMFEDLVAAE